MWTNFPLPSVFKDSVSKWPQLLEPPQPTENAWRNWGSWQWTCRGQCLFLYCHTRKNSLFTVWFYNGFTPLVNVLPRQPLLKHAMRTVASRMPSGHRWWVTGDKYSCWATEQRKGRGRQGEDRTKGEMEGQQVDQTQKWGGDGGRSCWQILSSLLEL